MSENWSLVARNYDKYDTPLRPNAEVVAHLSRHVPPDKPLIVALGATPIYGDLGDRVWFIDKSEDSLGLVRPRCAQQKTIHGDWFDSADAFAQADCIVGDGSLNSVGGAEEGARLLHLLKRAMRPGATLALRVYVRPERFDGALAAQLADALTNHRFTELRFLAYGQAAAPDGSLAVSAVDHFIARIGEKIPGDPAAIARAKADYFLWRGVSPEAAAQVDSRFLMPTLAQADAMFAAAGFAASHHRAGRFALAELTPFYVARAG